MSTWVGQSTFHNFTPTQQLYKFSLNIMKFRNLNQKSLISSRHYNEFRSVFWKIIGLLGLVGRMEQNTHL